MISQEEYDELHELAEAVCGGARSFISSFRYQPPEQVEFQFNVKLGEPLTDLAEFLERHPEDSE